MLQYAELRKVSTVPNTPGLLLATAVACAPMPSYAQVVGRGDTTAMLPGQVFRDCPTCPEMLVVPAGVCVMGSPESEEERLRFVIDEAG